MFDFFRNNMKFLMGLLMLLIIPSFVLFGVEGYSSFRQSNEVVARVGKTDITRPELDEAHRQEVDRLMASVPGLDRALLESAASRQATLERLIDERVLAQAAQDGHFLTTDQRLARELTQDPNIAALRKADGTLDVERYRELLRAQGLTPEQFEAGVRADLARRQVVQGVTQSALVADSVAQPALRAFFEQRELQVARFNPADFLARVQISDADLQQHYTANAARYQTPEQIDVEYLVLDLDAVMRGLTVSEADLRAYYEQNQAQLGQQEQRRASHILLLADAKAAPAEKDKVRAEAQALLAQLRESPSRFAELAKARSQDPGSAAQGGDLDFFARGAMVKPFEEAVFALQKGQISDVVESEFGFHIIQLTDVRMPKPEPFEQVRPRLEEELKRQQAQRRYAEAAEDFSNLVYEQGDTLAPAAQKLGLTVQKAEGVLRTGPAADPAASSAHAVLSQPRLLQALFANDAISRKQNTEAIEVGQNRLVSARVLAHRPAQQRPLADVLPQVREALLAERAQALAVEEGKARLAAWQQDASGAPLSPTQVVSRANPQGLPPAALTAALSAPAGPSVAAWAGVDLGPQGYWVLRVNRVLERQAPSAEQAAQERQQLVQLWAQAETRAYLQALRARYKTEIVTSKPGN